MRPRSAAILCACCSSASLSVTRYLGRLLGRPRTGRRYWAGISTMLGLRSPRIPARSRRSASIQFDLRQVGEVRLDQLEAQFRLLAVPAARRLDHARPLVAVSRRWNLALGPEQQNLVLVLIPVAGALLVLHP